MNEDTITKDLNRMKPEIKFVLSTFIPFVVILAFATHTDYMMDWITVNRAYMLLVMLTFFTAGRLVRGL